MDNKCTAILDRNIISSNLSINYDTYQKFAKIEIDFKNVIGLEDRLFSKFLKTNWKNEE